LHECPWPCSLLHMTASKLQTIASFPKAMQWRKVFVMWARLIYVCCKLLLLGCTITSRQAQIAQDVNRSCSDMPVFARQNYPSGATPVISVLHWSCRSCRVDSPVLQIRYMCVIAQTLNTCSHAKHSCVMCSDPMHSGPFAF